MSMMLCTLCGDLVDTDDDPDSLYVTDGKCFCWECREENDLETEFEREKGFGLP